MTILEMRKIIEMKTGIPARLLIGETLEENIAQAKAMLAYKREKDLESKATREQFANWLKGEISAQETALSDLENEMTAARPEAGADSETEMLTDEKSTREQFAEWLNG